ncbi:MAG TPA: argininosuccinate lyase [Alphaproteobacteria bacterium]|nr:argininosuccinate lyase [Alphaproteobacteria bacterium]
MASKKRAPKQQANKMWGGHYASGPAAIMAEINCSVDVDQRFYAQDIRGSQAHAAMLAARGIISKKDGAEIKNGLDKILKEIESGKFKFSRALEDVHMNIEARLKDLIGDAAGRLHTARSRNDQVATDFRLWMRDAIAGIDALLADLQKALIEKAETHAGAIMPGFTHLQPAQPVTFGHHLLAYVEMIGRDRARFRDAAKRMNEMPLGAAALAGTSFPIDRNMTAKALDFDRPMANSMDAVSARDFALEFLAASSIVGVHLSRFAEEITIWASPAFGFIKLSEAFTTGSSIMPQKRNPDAAELVRGKSGRLLGAFTTLSVVLKGLALTYAKDMQEDKEHVFDAVDTLHLMIAASAGMARDMKPNVAAMQKALGEGFITATDLADWLVRAANVPFRDAHHITGKAVRLAEQKKCGLEQLDLKDLKSVDTRITKDVFSVLKPENAVKSRTSFGGTAPANVKKAAKDAQKRFLSK